MSVVNKMLQDLEHRQSETAGADYVAPQTNYSRYYYLLIFIVALCVLAYWAKQVTNIGQPVIPVQSMPQVSAPAVAVPLSKPMTPIINQKLNLNTVKVVATAEQDAQPSQTGTTAPQDTLPSQVETAESLKSVADAEPLPVPELPQRLVTTAQQTTGSQTNQAATNTDETVAVEVVVPEPVTEPKPAPSHFSVVPSSAHGGEAVIWRNKAQRALNNKRYGEAAFALQKMLEIQPEDFLAVQQLAKVHVKLNDTVSAMDVLDEGIEITNNAHSLRLMLAQLYVSEDARPEALEVLKGFQPDIAFNADYYALQGALAQALEDYDVAYTSYYKLSLFDPKQGKWWLGLAAALDSLGDSQDSREAYQRALRFGRFTKATESFILQRISALGS